MVLPESVLGPFDARAFPDDARVQVAHAQPFLVNDSTGTSTRAVTARSTFGERLRTTDDPALNAQILVADLAVTYFGALTARPNDVPDASRGVAFAVPDDELALESFGPLLRALDTSPPVEGGGVAVLSPTTVQSLLSLPPANSGGEPSIRTFTPDPTPGVSPDMGDYPQRLDQADSALSAYESMVVETAPELVPPLRQLLDVSGARNLDADERQEYLDATTTTVDAGFGAIRIPEQDQITLTATEAEIPIVIENDLTHPVDVRIELVSSKLTFRDGDNLVVQLEPGRNRLPVTVNTVSAGTFPLEIAVRTPDSRVELGTDVIEVRSTAVSGLGLALSIGAGFFLLVWWARNWRNTRRTAAVGGPEPDPESPGPMPSRAGSAFTVGSLDDLREDDPPVTTTPTAHPGGPPHS